MRNAKRAALALALTSTTLGACSDDDGTPAAGATTRGTVMSTSATASRNAIVIKTQFVDFDGTVLAGSTIGDAPFCPGGTLHHKAGSPEIGHPAVNVFTCKTGRLEIGFGPGPDQMNNRVQTSDWDVVTGTGEFAGATGSGRMTVEFPSVGASRGRETFTGTIIVP